MRRAVFPPYSGQPPHGTTGASHSRKEEQRQPGSERYGERADPHGAFWGARGELCFLPLHSRRGYDMHGASGDAQQRTRCGASGDTIAKGLHHVKPDAPR